MKKIWGVIIIENLEKQLPVDYMAKIRNKKVNLGILSKHYLTYVLDAKKTVE